MEQKKPFSSRVHPKILDAFRAFEERMDKEAPFIAQTDLVGAALIGLMTTAPKRLKRLLDVARSLDTSSLTGESVDMDAIFAAARLQTEEEEQDEKAKRQKKRGAG